MAKAKAVCILAVVLTWGTGCGARTNLDADLTGTSGSSGTHGHSSSSHSTGPSGAGVSSGSGGMSGTGAGSGGAPGSGGGTACPAEIGPSEELIDDVSDDDEYVEPIGGRVGSWHTAHDSTPGAFIFPSALFQMSDTQDPCYGYAARLYGGPFDMWGASFGVGIGQPYNASRYEAIVFSARSGAGPLTIRVQLPDRDTQPDGGRCDPKLIGPNYCYDHYTAFVPISDEWQRFTVRYDELVQGGWGRPGRGFDPSTIYSIEFTAPSGEKFDLWVDNLAFLIGSPPGR